MSTTKAVTARVAHYCSTCQWRATKDDAAIIRPGHRYLRHVGFPGDDGVSGERPWVLRECSTCAIGSDDTAATQYGICGTYCCGVEPCVLPFDRRGAGFGHEHVCKRCIERANEVLAGSNPAGGAS